MGCISHPEQPRHGKKCGKPISVKFRCPKHGSVLHFSESNIMNVRGADARSKVRAALGKKNKAEAMAVLKGVKIECPLCGGQHAILTVVACERPHGVVPAEGFSRQRDNMFVVPLDKLAISRIRH